MHQRVSSKWLDALNSCSCECISQSVAGTGKEMKDKSKQSGFFFFWEHTAPSSVSVLTFQSIKCFFSFSFSSFIHLFMGGWVGGYLPLLLLQVCLQRWLCQGAPWCPSVCTDRSGCQPVSMERQFHIQLIQSQTFKAQSVAGCKLWYNIWSCGCILFKNAKTKMHLEKSLKRFLQRRETNAGTERGSKHTTHSALITHLTLLHNMISAYPLRPSVLCGFFCEGWPKIK